MKTSKILMLFGALSAVSGNVLAAETYSYLCKCIDTGYECEGGEYMYIDVNKNKVKWQMAYKPGDLYKGGDHNSGAADINSDYKPRTNTEFFKYDSRETSVYPYLLVKKGMTRGTRAGYVKKSEIQNGQYGHIWEYECKLD